MLLIMSWNVAAWPRTVDGLGENIDTYFERHAADIVCLQEVKVPKKRIVEEARTLGASMEGWQSFWAPCSDESQKGFQGVATFAKNGLTLRANPMPFGDPELDRLGRCIITVHQHFVLFNVYAPAACNRGGTSLRMKFFRALENSMKRERQLNGLPVILCGDLNLASGPLDVYYLRCSVNIYDLLEHNVCICNGISVDDQPCCDFKNTLIRVWPTVREALATRHVVPEISKSSVTGEPRTRFRLQVTIGEKTLKLGKLQDSESDCDHMFRWDRRVVVEDPDASESQLLICREGDLSVGELRELIHLVGGSKNERSQEEWMQLATKVGTSPTAVCVNSWFHKILAEGMVDTFRHFYPSVSYRYTCWNQYTNERYVNNGSRIDYFVVDGALKPVLCRGESLRCGCSECPPDGDPSSIARCAVTANGGYIGASFEGGGLASAEPRVVARQFGTPHTGFIYTPPKLSDHIAVSLLMSLECVDCVLGEDKMTKMSQPHKQQPSITQYFGAKRAYEGNAATGTTCDEPKRTKSEKGKKRTIASFFKMHSTTTTAATGAIDLTK